MAEDLGFKISVDSTGLDAAARKLADVNRQAQQVNQQGGAGAASGGVGGGRGAQALADAQALMDSRLAESANRRLLEQKRTDDAQGAARQSMWAAGITRLANPADRALQRYQEEQERLKAQGTQVTPGQLQHLNATRIHAQAEFAKFSGLVGHPDEAAQRMGLHGFAEPVGKAETKRLDEMLGSEADKRKGLLGILDKETDQRRKSYEDEQNRPKGGGVGAAAAGAASFGGALLGAAGISLSIAGIMSLLGLDSLFRGPALFESRERFGARMGGFGLGGGRAVGAGYKYGYTQDQSMPFGEAWAAQSGLEPGNDQFRMARAYNLPLEKMLPFGGLAFMGGERETTALLQRIASNVHELNVPLGRMGESFADYAQVVALGIKTQYNPSPEGIGDVMSVLGRVMGREGSGRVSTLFAGIQSGITNPAGDAQRMFIYRALGGFSGASYPQTMLRSMSGLFDLDPATIAGAQGLGWMAPGAPTTGLETLQDVFKQLRAYVGKPGTPGYETNLFAGVRGLLPGIAGNAGLVTRVAEEVSTGKEASAELLVDVKKELETESQKEEKRAGALVASVDRLAVNQEIAAHNIAGAYMPILTDIREWVAVGVQTLAPVARSFFEGPLRKFMFPSASDKGYAGVEAEYYRAHPDIGSGTGVLSQRARHLGTAVDFFGPGGRGPMFAAAKKASSDDEYFDLTGFPSSGSDPKSDAVRQYLRERTAGSLSKRQAEYDRGLNRIEGGHLTDWEPAPVDKQRQYVHAENTAENTKQTAETLKAVLEKLPPRDAPKPPEIVNTVPGNYW